MPEIKYELVDKIGVVSEGNNGWNKELNLISWNEREPVYDIRTWSSDHEKMGKGVTISVAEAKVHKKEQNDFVAVAISRLEDFDSLTKSDVEEIARVLISLKEEPK